MRVTNPCLPCQGNYHSVSVLLTFPIPLNKRSASRRPASAPVRFYGQHADSSAGPGRAVRPQSGGRQRGGALYQTTGRRPGSALARDRTHKNRGQDLNLDCLRDQNIGSSLPLAAWGVRPTSASSIAAGSSTRDFIHSDRTYEEVVICRGSRRVCKGFVARQGQQPRCSSAAADEQRHQGRGLRGRDPTSQGLLEGSAVCGSRLDLAINPSPWGAFVGGPPATRMETVGNKKRPSSAPRPPSTTKNPGESLLSGSETDGNRVQARPRSAHAASPSRTYASEALVARAYSSDNETETQQGVSQPAALGEEKEARNSSSRSSPSRWPVSAVDEAEPAEEAGGANAVRARGAGRARERAERSRRPRASGTADAELVVVARQVNTGTMYSEAKEAVFEVCEAASGALCYRKP